MQVRAKVGALGLFGLGFRVADKSTDKSEGAINC